VAEVIRGYIGQQSKIPASKHLSDSGLAPASGS
jgi:hypothetical protein